MNGYASLRTRRSVAGAQGRLAASDQLCSKLLKTALPEWLEHHERRTAPLPGYLYRYVFAEAAGHTDGRVTRQTLPGSLGWLWQGYTVK